MRLRILLLLPLLLVGCSDEKEYHYYNVKHEWSNDVRKHIVYVEDNEYLLNIEDVHYVFVKDYPCADTCYTLVLNEFYVKGQNYRLYVYKLDKWHLRNYKKHTIESN